MVQVGTYYLVIIKDLSTNKIKILRLINGIGVGTT